MRTEAEVVIGIDLTRLDDIECVYRFDPTCANGANSDV